MSRRNLSMAYWRSGSSLTMVKEPSSSYCTVIRIAWPPSAGHTVLSDDSRIKDRLWTIAGMANTLDNPKKLARRVSMAPPIRPHYTARDPPIHHNLVPKICTELAIETNPMNP